VAVIASDQFHEKLDVSTALDGRNESRRGGGDKAGGEEEGPLAKAVKKDRRRQVALKKL